MTRKKFPASYSIGLKLKELRNEFGMTGLDVAKKLNVSQQQVSRYEKGINKIDLDLLIKLSKIFDVSPLYFLENIEGFYDEEITYDNYLKRNWIQF